MDKRIYKPSKQTYTRATKLLNEGQLVSFPTETVYGLGADATNSEAVEKIYSIKGRPNFNPLIIHLSAADQAEKYVKLNRLAKKLAQAFWPGPFTMVLPILEKNKISPLITAGLDTVAVRVPENEIAHKLLTEFDRPIAAPSANKSGKVSPTTAAHVADEFDSDLKMIIDGGSCKKGIESTIVQVMDNNLILLRPGSITIEEIKSVTQCAVRVMDENNVNPSSPGQLTSHYAPKTKVRLDVDVPNKDECLLAFGAVTINSSFTMNLSPNGDLEEAAANLFSMLRTLDKMNFTSIAVSPIPLSGIGLAINDRLKRAAATNNEL
jgi:L-threonylcarbamoyladenylate synthase